MKDNFLVLGTNLGNVVRPNEAKENLGKFVNHFFLKKIEEQSSINHALFCTMKVTETWPLTWLIVAQLHRSRIADASLIIPPKILTIVFCGSHQKWAVPITTAVVSINDPFIRTTPITYTAGRRLRGRLFMRIPMAKKSNNHQKLYVRSRCRVKRTDVIWSGRKMVERETKIYAILLCAAVMNLYGPLNLHDLNLGCINNGGSSISDAPMFLRFTPCHVYCFLNTVIYCELLGLAKSFSCHGVTRIVWFAKAKENRVNRIYYNVTRNSGSSKVVSSWNKAHTMVTRVIANITILIYS